MDLISSQAIFSVMVMTFLIVILMLVVKKNSTAIWLYALQSVCVVALLAMSSYKEISQTLGWVILLTLILKVILAPRFFMSLVSKHRVKFAVSSYLSLPLTLIVVAIITLIVRSSLLLPISVIHLVDNNSLTLALSALFTSLFMIVNRRGAMSQMIGILSLENSIVAFASIVGLEQAPILQLGIVFDIFVWVIIATVFISMVYKQFGSLDVTTMTNLKE